MKKLFVISIALVAYISVLAQFKKPLNLPNYDNRIIHWGFTFGVNKLDFIMVKEASFAQAPAQDNLYGIVHKWQPGAHLGPVLEIRLTRYWKLRTLVNLTFQQRNMVYYFDHGEQIVTIPVASTFLQAPVLLKYNGARATNVRPYIIFGAAPTYDISALKRPNDNKPHVYLNTLDLIPEVGTGLEWFLPFFKLSTEIKFGRGLFNVLSPDNSVYTKYIQSLYTTYFMFSLHFEG